MRKFHTINILHYHTILTTSGDVIISGDVSLIVDSDLNGDSPQFTLTCISTGGPATTITWPETLSRSLKELRQ